MARIRATLVALTLTAALTNQATAQAEFQVEKTVQQGCDILLDVQEGKTSDRWPYEGVYRVRGEIPLGYHVGGTSICARALIEAEGFDQHDDRQAAVRRALDYVLNLLDDPLMASGFKGRYDVRGWGHTYALLLFLRLTDRGLVPDELGEIVRDKTSWLVQTLVETEIPKSGGWNYSRSRGFRAPAAASPFMTAPTLQALFWAQARGHEVDGAVIERAIESLERARTKSGGYTYSSGNRDVSDTEEDDLQFMDKQLGAVGRMVVVEATLELAGRGDAERLAAAVEAFFTHWQHLKDRKQQNGTHIEPGGVAPYYFMFAHRYAAQAIELLPEPDRKRQRARLLETLAAEIEEHGGWNDRVFERSRNYGTAFGMLALMAPELPRERRATERAEAADAEPEEPTKDDRRD